MLVCIFFIYFFGLFSAKKAHTLLFLYIIIGLKLFLCVWKEGAKSQIYSFRSLFVFFVCLFFPEKKADLKWTPKLFLTPIISLPI